TVNGHLERSCCEKHPGHADFIPIKEFTLQHLPEGYRNKDLYELIKAVADLTVRVVIGMTSPKRLEFWSNTTQPYPFYSMAAKRNLRTGSGEMFISRNIKGHSNDTNENIFNPDVDFSDTDYKTCPCEKCQDSETPSNVWYEIFVTTSTSCVFDEAEAKHTSCRLFYDDVQGNTLVKLNGFSIVTVDVEKDLTVMKIATCDITLGKKLHSMSKYKNYLLEKNFKEYQDVKSEFCFIVSHPHACSKRVTIGRLKDIYKLSKYKKHINFTKLTYTTATCPGSAGASVYCAGRKNAHVHCGALSSELNYSNVGYFYKK
ncbi:serine/threonine-protein kinase PLK1, partial [Biomphalaria glabrata]